MANPSYQTHTVSMAHCPIYMKSGQYSEIPGDSILGLYGEDFYKFQAASMQTDPTTTTEKWRCDQEPCTYCEKHTVAHAYIGPSPSTLLSHNKPLYQPTYGTRYVGVDEIYRRNPYEGIFRVPCSQRVKPGDNCM